MAATYWKGVTGDWSDAGNWTNGVPSAVNAPAVFDGRSQQSVTSGLGQGVIPFQLKTTPAYTGSIGAVGNPLIWNGGGALVFNVFRGSGNVHLQPSIANGDRIVVDAPNGSVFLTVCTLVELVVKAGTIVIAPTVDCPATFYLLGTAGLVILEEQATTERAPSFIFMLSGVMNNKRVFNETTANVQMSGGTINQTGVLGGNAVLVLHGGVFKYAPLAPVSGGPQIFPLGGLFDFFESSQTILTGDFYVGVDGAVRGSALQTAADVITFDFRENYP